MGFKLFGRGEKPGGHTDEQNRELLADIVRRTGGNDLREALSLALSGLDAEQRLAFAQNVVHGLPAVMRALILGEAGLTSGSWDLLRDSMTKEERRPKLVESLVQHGRSSLTLDFAAIPRNADVTVGLYMHKYKDRIPPPNLLYRTETPDISISAQARGGATFLTTKEIGGLCTAREDMWVPRRTLISLGTIMPPEGYQHTVAYGDPLAIGIDGNTLSADIFTVAGLRQGPYFVGSVALDRAGVFYR